MANAFKHTRHFRLLVPGSGSRNTQANQTFSSISDAQTKLAFTNVWETSSPTKTYALADSNQTLKVTYEFDTLDEQTAFKSAVDTLMKADNGAALWNTSVTNGFGQNFKTEWLHEDGSVSGTSDISW